MHPPRGRRLALLGAGALLAAGASPAVAAPAPASGEPTVATPTAADARTPVPGVWWYDAMHLEDVHETATGKGVKVAVIDIQLDPYVPDLRGAKISKGTDCLDNKPTKYWTGELASHGTAMTTAIVGQGAGGKGIVGVAPDAEVRFWSYDYRPRNGGYECDAVLIARQVDKAVAWGADVINMSLGVGRGLQESVGKALDAGVVVVASAGEVPDGEPRAEQPIESPANIPGVVAASAGDNRGKVWSKNPMGEVVDYSSLNQWLGVVAPGVETPLGGFTSDGTWVSADPRTGTSGASALTAGAFAVLKERWPEATGNQLIQSVLHHTGGDTSDGDMSYDKVEGFGTLSLRKALEVDPTGYPDENPLRMEPEKAIAAFPASVYDLERTADDAGADDTSPQADPQDDDASAAAGSSTDEPAGAEDGGSVPWWAVAVGVVLLAAAAAALLVRRRDAGTSAGNHPDHDTTDDRTAPRGS